MTAAQKILLVEDDEDDYVLARDMLAATFGSDLRLDWVSTWDEGLAAISDASHDVYLVDLRLGARTGLELVREAAARGCTKPIILLTGQDSPDIDLEAMEAGATDYLVKGQITADQLARSIRYGINQKCAEGDLLVARDEARAADRAKSEFLAAMSHELRTPLNAIIGFSEIIKDETFGPVGSVQYRDYANDIHESGQHLLALISDILDLSKIESGTDGLHDDNIEIPELIRSVLMLVRQRAEQGAIKVQLEIADQLPALRADERKLKQILVNLLSNAIKFSDAGGEVALWAWCRMGSGHVFQIIDTGIGIAPEDIPKALLRFGQIDGDLNRQYEGTGLGLPLTKALVEQHGGILDMQSQLGVGTTVTVRFPSTRIVRVPHDVNAINAADRKVG